MHLHNQYPKGTQDLLIDPEDPGIYAYAEAMLAEEKRLNKALRAVITGMVKNKLENDPRDHRTGFFTKVMEVMAEAMMAEGWGVRQVTDALVLEAVRAGGNVEGRETRKRMAAHAAKKAVQT